MAERRMFAKSITESDAFLEMPLSTQALYLHLNMNADYDDLSGYFEECIKESDRIINMYKEELDKLLEEPRLYDIYREERMEENEREREYWDDQL